MTLDLHAGANLISFYALPDELAISSIFDGFGAGTGVMGEGVGTINIGNSDSPNWMGSLTEVSQSDGYWVKVESDVSLSVLDAEPVNYDADGEVVYNMHQGNNLISYPYAIDQELSDAIPSVGFYGVAGEGIAAIALPDEYPAKIPSSFAKRRA